ncbi:hypothetical protein [Candidatus Pantoea soli]|uniref:DUF600 family protein n=1 Tax=Candidatus Pantoea soli TaxID=3098669 RepID=A0A518XI56_9GAMM|nr:hypothetical protein [Pantoea soli]QDY43883.1 hypothetical protein D8B20_18300 [Pantoea soli]
MQYEDLYRRIAQIIFSCGPEGAQALMVQAELPADEEGGEYQFNYLDEQGEPDWFEPDVQAIGDLTMALKEFQQYFIDHDLTEGKPVWTHCAIVINVAEESISIDVQ